MEEAGEEGGTGGDFLLVDIITLFSHCLIAATTCYHRGGYCTWCIRATIRVLRGQQHVLFKNNYSERATASTLRDHQQVLFHNNKYSSKTTKKSSFSQVLCVTGPYDPPLPARNPRHRQRTPFLTLFHRNPVFVMCSAHMSER